VQKFDSSREKCYWKKRLRILKDNKNKRYNSFTDLIDTTKKTIELLFWVSGKVPDYKG